MEYKIIQILKHIEYWAIKIGVYILAFLFFILCCSFMIALSYALIGVLITGGLICQ